MRPFFPIPSLRRSGVALAAVLLSTGLAACAPSGGAGGDTYAEDGVNPSASTGQGDGTGSTAERDAYDLELAECIRGRGVDVADPAPGVGITESGADVREAAAACTEEIGPPPTIDFSPEQESEMRTYYLDLAQCLRDRGYDVVDPEPQTALALVGVEESDFAACESEVSR